VRQSGVDITAKFSRTFDTSTLTTQLSASFIDEIDTAYSATASSGNLINTFGNPTKWRGRLDVAWARSSWALSGALNGVGGYYNLGALGNPAIASWMTVDLNGTINPGAYFQARGWQGISLSLVVLNALDRGPPYVSAPSVNRPNYDPANASPLGRFLALQIRKKW
jgi:iron complex outermembrane receptor protein